MSASTLTEWREIAIASMELPDDKLLSVLALVERVPYCGQVGEVLDRIRPRLAILRPRRVLTAQRLLFQPAEDLLVDARDEVAPGRLSRAMIEPCWRIVVARAPALVQAVEDELAAVDTGDIPRVLDSGKPYWARARSILDGFLKGEAAVGTFRFAGGTLTLTRDLLRQMSDFTAVLDVALEIEEAKRRLRGRPVPALSEADLAFLRRAMAALASSSLVRLATFVKVLMARVTCPGLLAGALVDMSCAAISEAQRAEVARRLARDAAVAVLSEAGRLRTTAAGDITSPLGAVARAEALVNRLVSLERVVQVAEAEAVRRDIGSFVLGSVVPAADRMIVQALGVLAARGVDEAFAFEHELRLDDCARSLRRAAGFAPALGIVRDLGERVDAVRAVLERDGPGAAASDPARPDRFGLLIRAIETLAGPDAAQQFLFQHLGSLDTLAGPP